MRTRRKKSRNNLLIIFFILLLAGMGIAGIFLFTPSGTQPAYRVDEQHPLTVPSNYQTNSTNTTISKAEIHYTFYLLGVDPDNQLFELDKAMSFSAFAGGHEVTDVIVNGSWKTALENITEQTFYATASLNLNISFLLVYIPPSGPSITIDTFQDKQMYGQEKAKANVVNYRYHLLGKIASWVVGEGASIFSEDGHFSLTVMIALDVQCHNDIGTPLEYNTTFKLGPININYHNDIQTGDSSTPSEPISYPVITPYSSFDTASGGILFLLIGGVVATLFIVFFGPQWLSGKRRR